jgi:hypothetical protein
LSEKYSASPGLTARAVVAKQLNSKRLERRMWTARTARRAEWAATDAVLAPLAEDPCEDDNGFSLVREAAGF